MTNKTPIWGGDFREQPNALMLAFCAGRDVVPLPMADAALLPFDLWTNHAHCRMLHEVGVLTAGDLAAIQRALNALAAEWQAGTFTLDAALEDVHANVERYVTQHAGAAGGHMHSGRSRNDQVACDMRLYLREALLQWGLALADLRTALLKCAAEHTHTLMPGFTHHQPAMWTTWGHWLAAHAQALGRDLVRVLQTLSLMNVCPLGAAAGYGTSWPLNRQRTAELLGFAGVQDNSLDCISGRIEHELEAAWVFSRSMQHLATFAQDLLLFSHPYWSFVRIPPAFVTGSSMMPHKQNPDFAEVLKGKSGWLQGALSSLMHISAGNPSGYHRDTQWGKYVLVDIVRECALAPQVMQSVLEGLEVKADNMLARGAEGFLETTDLAEGLASGLSIPFRQGYQIAADVVARARAQGRIDKTALVAAVTAAGHDAQSAVVQSLLVGLDNPLPLVEARQHQGAPAPEQVRSNLARQSEHNRDGLNALQTLRTTLDQAQQRASSNI